MVACRERLRPVRLGSAVYRYFRSSATERRALRRGLFFDVSSVMTPLMGVNTREGLLLVETNDFDLGRGTFARGPWDQDLIDFALRTVERLTEHRTDGGTVIEIGANIGTTTLLLARRYQAGRVIAFEPIPATARTLRAMIALNGLEPQVEVRECALTDAPGALSMELSARSPGDNRVRVGDPQGGMQGEADREVTSVAGSTFDEEISDLSDVRLVWMDAQGHEGHVLAGGQRLLASDVPVVTEFWPYGLRRSDGLETFCSLVEAHYPHVFDLAHGDVHGAMLYPGSAIRRICQRYPNPDDITDLILFKD